MSKEVTIQEAKKKIQESEKIITDLLNELSSLTNASDISIDITKIETVGNNKFYEANIIAEL